MSAKLPDGSTVNVPMFQVEFSGSIFQANSKSECRRWITEQKQLGNNYPKITKRLVDVKDKIAALSQVNDLLMSQEQRNTLLQAIVCIDAVIDNRTQTIDSELTEIGKDPETE